MRLEILNRGYSSGTKMLFAVIRVFSGHPVPDAAKLVFSARFLRRPGEGVHPRSDAWGFRLAVADRELMAAYISKVNGRFCVGARTGGGAGAPGRRRRSRRC